MRDRFALPLLALAALAMIVLAMVWPQGQGAPSPPPFNHPLGPLDENFSLGGRTITAMRGPRAVTALPNRRP